MARRKDLKNIASGLYGAFISRNNDIDGYWGIGKLCLHAKNMASRTVLIDLLQKTMTPQNHEILEFISKYQAILQKQLSSKELPSNSVVAASIELDFRPTPPIKKRIPADTWGALFQLTVKITDDLNKTHANCGYGYCGPHDPQKESSRRKY